MLKFEFLEHTADVKMRAFGATLEELFANVVLGMAAIQIRNPKSLSPRQAGEIRKKFQISKSKIQKNIKIQSENIETLLVDFLSVILTQSDIEHAVFTEVKIKKLTAQEIKAEIFGAEVDKFDEDIKAVTYHGVEVKKKNGNWEAVVLFDV